MSYADRREFKRLSDRIFHRSLDACHGACLLKQPGLAQIVADAILYCREAKYDLARFVIMPNHVHAIVQFRSDANLKVVSQSWMRHTARQINATTGQQGPFWQPEPFDHIIRSLEQFEYLQSYVVQNPQRIPIPCDDPNVANYANADAETYDKRCSQFAREMLYVFSRTKR